MSRLIRNRRYRGRPAGGNVLFTDGHVEYRKYPGAFPMAKVFIEGPQSLDALGSG
jgi:prepilin-type processing-associated H-X9-DG protein